MCKRRRHEGLPLVMGRSESNLKVIEEMLGNFRKEKKKESRIVRSCEVYGTYRTILGDFGIHRSRLHIQFYWLYLLFLLLFHEVSEKKCEAYLKTWFWILMFTNICPFNTLDCLSFPLTTTMNVKIKNLMRLPTFKVNACRPARVMTYQTIK